jgi:hypothetical protein
MLLCFVKGLSWHFGVIFWVLDTGAVIGPGIAEGGQDRDGPLAVSGSPVVLRIFPSPSGIPRPTLHRRNPADRGSPER